MSIEDLNKPKINKEPTEKLNPGAFNVDMFDKEVPIEKIKQVEKIILDTLCVESDNGLNNFDEKLKNAIRLLPKYQQLEKKLKESSKQDLTYVIFSVLKKEADDIKIYNQNIPKDGTLIKSMKQGVIECSGRTMIASTFLREHSIDHTVALAPGHAFVIIEPSDDTLIYLDANNNLCFSFPKSALSNYSGTDKTSECFLKEYLPRDEDFVYGIDTVFPHFITIPSKEGVGRLYFGNVAAGLSGNKEFETSGLVTDKGLEDIVQQIKKQMYGENAILEDFDLRIEELSKIQESQMSEEKAVVNEILRAHPTRDDFIKYFIDIVVDGDIGARIPYIKTASIERKKDYSEKVWEILNKNS